MLTPNSVVPSSSPPLLVGVGDSGVGAPLHESVGLFRVQSGYNIVVCKVRKENAVSCGRITAVKSWDIGARAPSGVGVRTQRVHVHHLVYRVFRSASCGCLRVLQDKRSGPSAADEASAADGGGGGGGGAGEFGVGVESGSNVPPGVSAVR